MPNSRCYQSVSSINLLALISVLGLLSAFPLVARAEGRLRRTLQITNILDSEVLNYPCALLRGKAGDRADTVRIQNPGNTRIGSVTVVPVIDGRFVAVVELSPGMNHLDIRCGNEQMEFTLIYQRVQSGHYVNVIYLTAADSGTHYLTQLTDDPQDYADKLGTALKLMQTLTAERMNDIGFGRSTFALDLDNKGKVIIHTLKFPDTAAHLQTQDGGTLYHRIYPLITQRFPQNQVQNVVIMAFSSYDPVTKKPHAHCALGAPGMGLFSCNGMCAWPSSISDVQRSFSDTTPVDNTKLWDDSNSRSVFWGLAATTMGAVLHEMGHSFGLPHVADPESIMSRGFDHFNRVFTITEPAALGGAIPTRFVLTQSAYWDKESAKKLVVSPWFHRVKN